MVLNPNAAPFVMPNAAVPGAAPLVAPAPQIAAPAPAAPAPAPAPPPGAVIAYANNFDAKHTVVAMTATAAANAGNARGGGVAYSTVFLRAFLLPLILNDAVGKLAGTYSHSIACHQAPPGSFQLAELTRGGTYRAIPTPMFFCKVVYRVTFGAGGGQIVTLAHIETDF